MNLVGDPPEHALDLRRLELSAQLTVVLVPIGLAIGRG